MDLTDAIRLAARFAERRDPFDLLVLDHARIMATTLSTSITVLLDTPLDFAAAVPVKPLLAATKHGGTGIAREGDQIRVATEHGTYSLPVTDPQNMPATPQRGGDIEWHAIRGWRDAVQAVGACVSKDGSRPHIAGVHLSPRYGLVEATDGTRLLRRAVDWSLPATLSLPASYPTAALAAIDGGSLAVDGDGRLFLHGSDVILVVQPFRGQFPDVDRVIPKWCDHPWIVPRPLLEEVLQAAGGVAAGFPAALTAHGTEIKVTVRTELGVGYQHRIPLRDDGKGQTAVNARLMLSVVRGLPPGDLVELHVREPLDPILVCLAGDRGANVGVVMPMRL